MTQSSTDFYLQFSQYTFPGLYGSILRDSLPDDVREIGQLVRKQIIHRMTVKNGNTGSNSDVRYGDVREIPWWRQPEDDVFPTASAMIAELYRRDPQGFTARRCTPDKLILTCRFTSILMASLLKIKGIPARVRSGFAPYFSVAGLPGGKSDDHWITEYWDSASSRWIAIDVDGSLENLPFDPYDIPRNVFDYSADAWHTVRTGSVSADHFWNAGGYGGLPVIAWELFYDFHCLMNSEIVYFHHPEMTVSSIFRTLPESKLIDIDELAEYMREPDANFSKLFEIWETNREFRLLKGGLL